MKSRPAEIDRRRGPIRRALRWAEHVLAATGLAFLAYHVCFDVSVVVSDSMSPTLKGTAVENGDWVLTEKVSGFFRPPRRWEVVAFTNGEGTRVMKRVAGLPGEAVSMRDRAVCIDGSAARRPASLDRLAYLPYGNVGGGKEFRCDGGYYVLGDRTEDSEDSRFEGVVRPEQVVGRAWLILWPPSRMGFVNP